LTPERSIPEIADVEVTGIVGFEDELLLSIEDPSCRTDGWVTGDDGSSVRVETKGTGWEVVSTVKVVSISGGHQV
jgi:hypothetical protein